jgi:hypothetical protein
MKSSAFAAILFVPRDSYFGVTPRKFLGDRVTLVPGAIVDNDELEFHIVGRNIENMHDACLQRRLFIVTRHHKRERLWCIHSGYSYFDWSQ